jgi:hypothetical protein
MLVPRGSIRETTSCECDSHPRYQDVVHDSELGRWPLVTRFEARHRYLHDMANRSHGILGAMMNTDAALNRGSFAKYAAVDSTGQRNRA